jgi:hypothetical protein
MQYSKEVNGYVLFSTIQNQYIALNQGLPCIEDPSFYFVDSIFSADIWDTNNLSQFHHTWIHPDEFDKLKGCMWIGVKQKIIIETSLDNEVQLPKSENDEKIFEYNSKNPPLTIDEKPYF